MEIRPARESDAESVLDFLGRYRAEGLNTILKHDGIPSVEEQREFIRSHDGRLGVMLLCVKNGDVVGSLTASRKRHAQLQHSCEFGMGVLATDRSQGIGSSLIEELLKWARASALSRVELSVASHNKDAIRLYEKFGFQIEGRKRFAMIVDGKFEDIIEMARVEPTGVGNSGWFRCTRLNICPDAHFDSQA